MTTALKVILFTDEIGSSLKTPKRTLDEVARINVAIQRLTENAVQKCGGVLGNDTGDGKMIMFNSCREAVRCGYLIQQDIAARNYNLAEEYMQVMLHVGIDFGEALLLGDKDLRAAAANRAARVTGASGAGEVYFTDKVNAELHPREAETEFVDEVPLRGTGVCKIYRLKAWKGKDEEQFNPFTRREGITRDEDFYGREAELRRLRSLLANNGNCQVVGERRIGKSSLLLKIARKAGAWQPGTVVAYVTMQHARSRTQATWLEYVSGLWKQGTVITNQIEFSEAVMKMTADGQRPVLLLDEFEEMAQRRDAFDEDFLLTLRSCSQQGLSIITASRQTLDKLTMPGTLSSSFFNVFSLIRLNVFEPEEAEDFINAHRPGVPLFTAEEQAAIGSFARRHPLALQVACEFVLDAKLAGKLALPDALKKAQDEMKSLLPVSW